MANKFFNAIKSAFVITEEENNPSVPVSPIPQTIVQQPQFVPVQNTGTVETKTVTNTVSYNQKLMDKLCERMEEAKQGGLDYLDLKQTTTDTFIVESVPDEQKRFGIAFRTLQISRPELTKQMILSSIDYYVGKLKQWEKEAIDGLNDKRKEVAGKKNDISAIEEEITKLIEKKGVLQNEVNTIEEQCNQNENDMVQTVGFLVGLLNEDKERINKVLN